MVTTICPVPDLMGVCATMPCNFTWSWLVLTGQGNLAEQPVKWWPALKVLFFFFFFLARFLLLLIFLSAWVHLQTPHDQISYLSVRSFQVQRQMLLPPSVSQGLSLFRADNLYKAGRLHPLPSLSSPASQLFSSCQMRMAICISLVLWI